MNPVDEEALILEDWLDADAGELEIEHEINPFEEDREEGGRSPQGEPTGLVISESEQD